MSLRRAASSTICAAPLAFLLAIAGCNQGPKAVTVTGTVLRDNQPITVSPTGVVQVTLMPDVGPNEQFTTYVGRCEATGKFEVVEVPVGTYKIGVEQLDPNPQVDKLGGEFSLINTKIKRQVDGKSPLEIDLARPDK